MPKVQGLRHGRAPRLLVVGERVPLLNGERSGRKLHPLSRKFEEHCVCLTAIFDRLKRDTVKVKPTKCHYSGLSPKDGLSGLGPVL